METFKLENYLIFKNKIGKGSFSNVYKGIDTRNNLEVAIKKIHQKSLFKLRSYIDREISLMKKLDHPNILKLYDVIYTSSNNIENIYLILEYCSNGDLSQILKSEGVEEKVAKKYLKQLSEGLKYLKDNHVSHRDLKPQNILINKEGVLKITDFGFAKRIENSNMSETFCGSPLYMAPEILTYKKYTDQADLWSVGVILYELLTGKIPFNGKDLYDLVRKIKTEEVVIPNYINLSSECKHILFSLLQKDPKRRLNWDNFYKHPWFKDYDEIDKLYANVFDSDLNLNMSHINCDSVYSDNSIEDELMFQFEEDIKEVKVPKKKTPDDDDDDLFSDFILVSNSLPIDIKQQKGLLKNFVSSIGNLGTSLYEYAKSI